MAKLEEENPALGWRAIRIGLDRPGLLRSQLRALLRAGAGRELRIMFPMVAMAQEFDEAKRIVQRELAHLQQYDYDLPTGLKLGVMVEVPSLLWQLDEIVERADFLSVGTNDLLQYFYAADRDNKRVAGRFDALSAPPLRALKSIATVGQSKGKPITLCGEMGGKPLEAITLIALGYRDLSMTPSAMGPVKAAVLAMHVGEMTAFVDQLVARRDGAASLREELRRYAEARDIPL
jgi:phosphotransferase system enzyme I (PtsP)